MGKLYALEEQSEETPKNDLLIDKVLQKAQQPKSPLSLTADLIKQRQELKKDIGDKLEKDPEDQEDQNNNNPDDNNNNDDQNSDNQNQDNNDSGNSSSDNGNTNDQDDSSAAEDKDSLSNLVGSGISSDDDKKEEKKEEPATESLKTHIISLKNIFKPLNKQYNTYRVSLESYCLENKAVPPTEQPVAYVKDSLIESLNNLVALAGNYITNNTNFVETNRKSITSINERITVLKAFIENTKYHFTNKLINDKDILANVSCPGKSDLRDTLKVMINYIEASTRATSLVISNEFNTLESGYSNSDFIKDGDDLKYKDTLPGFNDIRLHIEPYKNYLSTNIQNFQYYKLKVFKTEDLYNLNAISVTEDKELQYIASSLDKLLLNISLASDNLSDVNTHFAKFVDDIKAIIYDINQDKYKNLNEIDIDSKIQDFVKFKLAIETYYVNINIMIEYMTSIISIINECIELKD